MKIKIANDQYIEKVKLLSDEEIEKLQCRMGGKLIRRAEENKVTLLEALAIQLETEDAELEEWRQKRAKLVAKADKSSKAKK